MTDWTPNIYVCLFFGIPIAVLIIAAIGRIANRSVVKELKEIERLLKQR